MDHGGHMPMPKCKLSMLWNTDIIDTCIVFKSWHITSYTTFILSILVIIGLGVAFEYLRVLQRKLDAHIAVVLDAKGGKIRLGQEYESGVEAQENASLNPEDSREAVWLASRRRTLRKEAESALTVPIHFRAFRALAYGTTVFLSFFLMLVFMTYNAYYIGAVVIGATFGHYIFGATINPDSDNSFGPTITERGMACH